MTNWIPANKLKPTVEDCGLISNQWRSIAGGISPTVLVAVSCDNGEKFVSIDEWDKRSQTWMRYHTDHGQHVTHWQRLPEYPNNTNEDAEVRVSGVPYKVPRDSIK
jgi:hypothetical protein